MYVPLIPRDSFLLTSYTYFLQVAYVEKDSQVFALEDPVTEHSAPWGLARISHRDTLGFGTFNKYIHQASGGEGVDVYVIDTGTNYEHVDFEGRAKWGKTIPRGDADEDGNGHGTHCSGTIGGKKYGVSKKANIIAVKVLRSNGSGTMSDVVKGVEWAATSHAKTASGKDAKFKGSVANMSLGGGKSPTLDLSVNAAVSVSCLPASWLNDASLTYLARWVSTLPLLLVTITRTPVTTLLLRLPMLLQLVPPLSLMRGPTSPTTESVSISLRQVSTFSPPGSAAHTQPRPSLVPPWPAPTLLVSSHTSFPSSQPLTLSSLLSHSHQRS